MLRPGDLLFAWSGNRGTSFGPFLWDRPFDAYLNQHIFKLSGYSCHKRYFYYLLRAVTRHVEERTHGIIGLVHITKPELGAISVPIPPEPEQLAIAAFLDNAWADIDGAISQLRRQIEQMREYRSRLIADVVTGKVDVRQVVLDAADLTLEVPSANDDLLEGPEGALEEGEEVTIGDE